MIPIQSSIDGHLRCFYIMAVVQKAAVNVGVHGGIKLSEISQKEKDNKYCISFICGI